MASQANKQQAPNASSKRNSSHSSGSVDHKSINTASMSQNGFQSAAKKLQTPMAPGNRDSGSFDHASGSGPLRSSSLRSESLQNGGTSTRFDRRPSTLNWLAHQQNNQPLLKHTALQERPHRHVDHVHQPSRLGPNVNQPGISTHDKRARWPEPVPFTREELLKENEEDLAEMGAGAYQSQHQDNRRA